MTPSRLTVHSPAANSFNAVRGYLFRPGLKNLRNWARLRECVPFDSPVSP
jgi:hypothetical protein